MKNKPSTPSFKIDFQISLTTLLIILILIGLMSCTSTEANVEADVWTKIETVFKGNYIKKDIKPLLESVMLQHNEVINDENIYKCANTIYNLRLKSIMEVSEMDILKHMYQHKTQNIFYIQAIASFNYLEKHK